MNKKTTESWHHKRHDRFFKFFYNPVKWFAKMKDGFTLDKESKTIDGPALIISNHLTTYDPINLELAAKEVIYLVASDDLFNKKLAGWFLKTFFNPIPKSKSVSDIKCVKTILKVLKEGYKVALFPEGNRSYTGTLSNVDKSIAKLAKVAKVPIIVYNMEGGFAVDPRWGYKHRKGEVHCTLRNVIEKDEVLSLSTDELYDKIIEYLTVSPYTYSIGKKNKKIAEYVERALYYCPNCDSFETINSHIDKVFCFKCGYELKYNHDMTFTLINGERNINTVDEWYNIQRRKIESFDPFLSDKIIYEDYGVTLYSVVRFRKRKPIIKKGHLMMTNKEIIIEGQHKKTVIPIDSIRESCVVLKNKANFYVEEYLYQLQGRVRFCSLKYVQLVHHIKNIKNGTSCEGEFLGL
ncbi:1-acyl-sn-glycerol-3-phosphate acyltransferase [bacterium]|nr:1-acyl-sn-glycerol-3-phosphate acyltransferase [bacterium]